MFAFYQFRRTANKWIISNNVKIKRFLFYDENKTMSATMKLLLKLRRTLSLTLQKIRHMITFCNMTLKGREKLHNIKIDMHCIFAFLFSWWNVTLIDFMFEDHLCLFIITFHHFIRKIILKQKYYIYIGIWLHTRI